MKPCVGIAYTTFNRVGLWRYGFMKLIQTTLRDKRADYILSISDDGSDEVQLEELKKMVAELRTYCVVQFETGRLANIAHNRNRALHHVQTCDYIFSFEDDIYPYKPDWLDGYIECLKAFPHLMYLPQCMWPNEKLYKLRTVEDKPDFHIMQNAQCGGIMMAFTRDIIDEVGGFNSAFDIYGYEHAELTERINRHLRIPHNTYLTIKEAETGEWFVSADEKNMSYSLRDMTWEQWKAIDTGSIGQRLTPEQIQVSINKNGAIWMKSRQQMDAGILYREIKWK